MAEIGHAGDRLGPEGLALGMVVAIGVATARRRRISSLVVVTVL